MLMIRLLEGKIVPLILTEENAIKKSFKTKKDLYHCDGLETSFPTMSCLRKMEFICPRYEQKTKGRSKQGLKG